MIWSEEYFVDMSYFGINCPNIVLSWDIRYWDLLLRKQIRRSNIIFMIRCYPAIFIFIRKKKKEKKKNVSVVTCLIELVINLLINVQAWRVTTFIVYLIPVVLQGQRSWLVLKLYRVLIKDILKLCNLWTLK